MSDKILVKKSSLQWFYRTLKPWQKALVDDDLKVDDQFLFSNHPDANDIVLEARLYGGPAGWPMVYLTPAQEAVLVEQFGLPKGPDDFWSVPELADDDFEIEFESVATTPAATTPPAPVTTSTKPKFWTRKNPFAKLLGGLGIAAIAFLSLCGLCSLCSTFGSVVLNVFGQ